MLVKLQKGKISIQELKMSDRLLLIFMLMLVTRVVTHGHAELATPRHGGLGDNSFQNNRSDHQVEIAAQRSSLLNSTAAVSLGNIETGETRRRHSVEDSSSSNVVRLAVAMKALELENKQLKFTLKELQATTEKFATKWQESNFAISQLTAVNQQQQLAIGQLQLQVSQLSTNTMKLQDENEAFHTQMRSLQEEADSNHEQTQSQLLKVSNLTSGLQAENSSINTQLSKVLDLISGLQAENSSIYTQLSKVVDLTSRLQAENSSINTQLSKVLDLISGLQAENSSINTQLSKVVDLTSRLQAENSSIYTQLLQVSNLTSELRAEDRSIYSQLRNITDLTTGLYTANSSIYTQLHAFTADVIAGKTREETDRLDLLEKVGKLQTQSRYLESNMSKRSSALEERLTSQVIQLQQKDQELMQTIIDRTHVDKVGFHARLSYSSDVKTTGTLVLNSVQLNIGDGYNSATGIFTAPVGGVYLFLANMAADSTGKSAWIKIFLGETELCRAYSRFSTDIEMASCHAATSLIKGNQVRIVKDGSTSYKIRGDFWTTFTGVLIKS